MGTTRNGRKVIEDFQWASIVYFRFSFFLMIFGLSINYFKIKALTQSVWLLVSRSCLQEVNTNQNIKCHWLNFETLLNTYVMGQQFLSVIKSYRLTLNLSPIVIVLFILFFSIILHSQTQHIHRTTIKIIKLKNIISTYSLMYKIWLHSISFDYKKLNIRIEELTFWWIKQTLFFQKTNAVIKLIK